MAREANIVATLRDQVSQNADRMGDSMQRFSKDVEDTDRLLQAYGKRQDEISRQTAKTQTALDKATDELKKAKKAYADLNDEANEKALEEAHGKVNSLTSSLKDYKQAANDTQRAMRELNDQSRKSENLGGGSSVLGQLAQAGMLKMVGDSLADVANVAVGSAFGSDVGGMFSSTLSGVASGAALGSIIPGIGTAIGAAVGGITGALSGATQIFERQDDAFKSYVQEQTEAQLSTRTSDITSGSSIAGQREQDAIAFNTLLGAGKGDDYLTKLRTLAADTPMEYGDLTTMSRSLATGFKDDPERMLELMRDIGDAGSALGVDASGMNTMATAMSRMQSSGKVSLEYLNLIQERGVDAVGMLAEGLGVSKSTVYDRISKGAIDGANAVDILQEKMRELFGGSMDTQSKTFAGLSSTLEDAQKEIQNAYGEGYNAERGKGIKDQTDWLSGVSGEAQQEANKAIGAWQASLENSKEQAIRDAVDDAMATDEYRQAKAAGDAAEMGRIIMAAKVKGQSEYNASEGAQLALESELSLAAAIQDDTGSNNAYWNAGYRKSQEYSKGWAAGLLAGYADDFAAAGGTLANGGYYDAMGNYQPGQPPGFAYGLDRVPYDNFPALLHEGERVQTAGQARQQDAGGTSSGIQIDVHDCNFAGSTQEQAEQLIKIVAEGVARASALRVP